MLSETVGKLLNRALPRSERARQLCAELAGRSLALEVRGIGRLSLQSNGATLTVTPAAAGADAELSVGPFGLLALAGADGAQSAVQRGDAAISGDGEIAAKFGELLTLLKPDPEEELSAVLGDVPAHQLARLGRLALAFGRRATDAAWRNAGDYLGHERGDLVPRSEGEQFLKGVDALREDLDRLAVRLELLAARRAAAAGGKRAP
ncbi:MAG TPA: SCP2 sterol-binding domain-containing protein [Steroidobacteraceae bacterium]|nr:SCP2 sterol-binding domain-containing protein [Steroidobacteraceae bacterium]